MHRLWIRPLTALLAILLAACGGPRPPATPAAPATLPARAVVLVSLDGFRWDYPDLYATPTLDRIAAAGARATRMVPSFPSKTFPNHYTLVTGLHPGHHGVVGNDIWDPELGWFGLALRDAVGDARWWGGEPVWVTAERRGLATAPVFWPGSEAAIGGDRPARWRPYDHDVPAEERVARVLAALAGEGGPAVSFATLYLADVDDAGHRHGPRSPATAAAVGRVDAALGALLDGLDGRGLDHVDVVVGGDHGMAAVSRRRVIVADDHVDLDGVEVAGWSPVLGIWPKTMPAEDVLRRLRAVGPQLRVYRRAETPAAWHYRDHPRIPPVVAVAAEGWTITTRGRLLTRPHTARGGDHGYDPTVARSMDTVLYAVGPHVRPGVRTGAVAAVDVYALLCHLLDLPPHPHDGDAAALAPFVR